MQTVAEWFKSRKQNGKLDGADSACAMLTESDVYELENLIVTGKVSLRDFGREYAIQNGQFATIIRV
jgi:hypothetical protein